MKIRNFGTSKDITKKVKKKTNLMEKYFQIMYLMKDLYLENECKELLELNNKKIHNRAQKKETINKTKRQPMEWKEIFANNATDKGLISRIYKQLIQLSKKKKKNPTQLKIEQKT